MSNAQTKSDYTVIDAAILRHISDERSQMSPLLDPSVRREANLIASATGRESYRVIDGRLKCLRNAGKIVYQYGKGARWVLSPVKNDSQGGE